MLDTATPNKCHADMGMNSVLGVIGVFLIGAATGAALKYARYRSLVALCNDLAQRVDGAQRFEESCAACSSGSCILGGTAELPSGSSRVFRNTEQRNFQLWAGNLLTCLGAPIRLGEREMGRILTLAERVEWLQARNG